MTQYIDAPEHEDYISMTNFKFICKAKKNTYFLTFYSSKWDSNWEQSIKRYSRCVLRASHAKVMC